MTFATVNWLSRWYWPEQLLFWAVFGHTASTIRAIMNVKTLLMWTIINQHFKAQKPSLTYHTVDMAGREKLSHMFQNRRHSRSSWIERYSDLFHALHQPLYAWVSICNKLTRWRSSENMMMRIVEQISPTDACTKEQITKNQYTGSSWADSLNNAATRAL